MENTRVNILIAFPYFKRAITEYLRDIPKDTYRLIVDSGAFTAWNIGKQINLDEYCRFLDSIEYLRPFNAVQLDVFGDPEGTWKNFGIMKSRGYDVMPVFTRGDSLERLDEMYRHTDYIMFGGITVGGKNLNYVKWFSENNKGRHVHWLGFCNVDFIKHYHPFSVDSSSWASGARFGNVAFYRGYGQLKTMGRKAFLTMPPDSIFKMAKTSGITKKEIALLQDRESWITSEYVPSLEKPMKSTANFISAIANVHRAADLEKNTGTRYFFACVQGGSHPDHIFQARNFLIERGVISGHQTRKPRTRTTVLRKRQDRLPSTVLT